MWFLRFLFLISAFHFLLLIGGLSATNCIIDKGLKRRHLLMNNEWHYYQTTSNHPQDPQQVPESNSKRTLEEDQKHPNPKRLSRSNEQQQDDLGYTHATDLVPLEGQNQQQSSLEEHDLWDASLIHQLLQQNLLDPSVILQLLQYNMLDASVFHQWLQEHHSLVETYQATTPVIVPEPLDMHKATTITSPALMQRDQGIYQSTGVSNHNTALRGLQKEAKLQMQLHEEKGAIHTKDSQRLNENYQSEEEQLNLKLGDLLKEQEELKVTKGKEKMTLRAKLHARKNSKTMQRLNVADREKLQAIFNIELEIFDDQYKVEEIELVVQRFPIEQKLLALEMEKGMHKVIAFASSTSTKQNQASDQSTGVSTSNTALRPLEKEEKVQTQPHEEEKEGDRQGLNEKNQLQEEELKSTSRMKKKSKIRIDRDAPDANVQRLEKLASVITKLREGIVTKKKEKVELVKGLSEQARKKLESYKQG